MYNVLGTLGMNRVILRHKFGVPQENGVFNYQYMVCEEDRHRANLIGELVQVRDGQLHLHMSQCEVCTFIECVYDVNFAKMTMNTVDCTAHICTKLYYCNDIV